MIPNDKFINESTVNYRCSKSTREKPCNYAPGVRIFLIEELKRVYVHLKAIEVSSKKILLDQAFSLCKFDKQAFDVLINIVFDIMINHINFKLSCPFKQGVYESLPFKQNFGIFLNLFQLNQPQKYTAVLKGIFENKLVTFFVYEITFEIVEIIE